MVRGTGGHAAAGDGPTTSDPAIGAADVPPAPPHAVPDGPATPHVWLEDLLGPDFQQRTMPLADDEEGEVVATLVRHHPPEREGLRPARAVLYVHGWSDYFFQTHLAEYWTALGAAFYALDLRKYGRSLRDHQSPGYVTDLATYDEDIEAALAVIAGELGAAASVRAGGAIVVVGATTGDPEPTGITRIFFHELRVLGSTMGSAEDLRELLALLERSGARPVVDSTFPLGEARDAFARLERGEQFGKIVLTV